MLRCCFKADHTGKGRSNEYDTRFGPRPDQMIGHRLPAPGACVKWTLLSSTPSEKPGAPAVDASPQSVAKS